MVRHIRIILDDNEFEAINNDRIKSGMTWKEVLLRRDI